MTAGRVRLPRAAALIVTSADLVVLFIAAGAPSPLLPIYEQQWSFAPWLLTLAFGAYALGLLAALLVVGSLSDHVGRRPVLIGSLALELVAMLVFLTANDIDEVVAARILQGIATGAATSAFTAAVLELAPKGRARLGTLVGTLSPLLGLGVGALAAGAVAQLSGAPALTVWLTLVALVAAGATLAAFVPETADRTPGALASLRPRVAVPAALRGAFAATVPAQVAAWMTAALFLGLMPTILGTAFGSRSPLENGATAFIEPAAAAVAALLVGRIRPHRLVSVATTAVLAGGLLVTAGVLTTTLPLLWAGGVIGGVGFGSTFGATMSSLVPRAHEHERAGLVAAVFVVAYLAFGLPAIAAGALIPGLGLRTVVIGFAALIATCAAIGFAVHHLARRHATRTLEAVRA